MGGRFDAGVETYGGVHWKRAFPGDPDRINFADARNATTSEQLDAAGEEFAKAVAEIEIDVLLPPITHRIGGSAKGGARPAPRDHRRGRWPSPRGRAVLLCPSS